MPLPGGTLTMTRTGRCGYAFAGNSAHTAGRMSGDSASSSAAVRLKESGKVR